MVAEEVDYEELAALLTDSHVPLGKPTVVLTDDAAAAAGLTMSAWSETGLSL